MRVAITLGAAPIVPVRTVVRTTSGRRIVAQKLTARVTVTNRSVTAVRSVRAVGVSLEGEAIAIVSRLHSPYVPVPSYKPRMLEENSVCFRQIVDIWAVLC
jgi:hypothetical protein